MGKIPSTQTTKFFLPENLLISLGITLAALGIGYFRAVFFDVFHSGFSNSDESAHFVNSYFLWNYLTGGQLNDPLGYAQEFYTAYPRLSIGHWPPFYYLFVGLLFFAFPPMPETAMAINLLVSTAPVFLIAYLVQQFASWRWALLAGFAYAVMPLPVQAIKLFMLDQPVTLVCLAAAICWQAYARSPRYVLALTYGALAAAAVLVKGNGGLLGLFPLFHILLGRHWHLLRVPPTYIGAVFALVVALPWYWFTTKVSAQGFVFEFGSEYALRALVFNIGALKDNLGFLGLGFSILGTILPFTQTEPNSPERRLAVTSISLILATLALQSLVPVALVGRYMAPALPFAVILAVIAFVLLIRIPWIRHRLMLRRTLNFLAVGILLIPGVSFLLRESPQINLRMADAAERVLTSGRPEIIVIDGSTGAEGAFIAEVMVRANGHRIFVVRGSKLLSHSDFMGNNYRSYVNDRDDVMRRLSDLGAAAIVLERHTNGRYYLHNKLLIEYLNSDASPYRRVSSFKHFNRDGVTHVYMAAGPVVPNVNMVRKVNFPHRKADL